MSAIAAWLQAMACFLLRLLRLQKGLEGRGSMHAIASAALSPCKQCCHQTARPPTSVDGAPVLGHDEIALAMLTLSGGEGNPEEADPAQLSAVPAGLAQAKRRVTRKSRRPSETPSSTHCV